MFKFNGGGGGGDACFCQDHCYLNLIRGFKITFEQSERFERKTLNSRLLLGKNKNNNVETHWLFTLNLLYFMRGIFENH